MSHEKLSDFVSSPLIVFPLVTKLKNFNFESHLNTLIFFIKENDVKFEYALSNIV